MDTWLAILVVFTYLFVGVVTGGLIRRNVRGGADDEAIALWSGALRPISIPAIFLVAVYSACAGE